MIRPVALRQVQRRFDGVLDCRHVLWRKRTETPGEFGAIHGGYLVTHCDSVPPESSGAIWDLHDSGTATRLLDGSGEWYDSHRSPGWNPIEAIVGEHQDWTLALQFGA